MYKGDPVRVKGPITIKGLRTNFELINCRELTSIRIQDMDPLCGNLNFQNCAMEADDITKQVNQIMGGKLTYYLKI